MPSAPLSASVRVGVAALRVNPLRTGLSALGMIIGVGAMISVLSLSDGVETALRSQLERDGRMQTVGVSSRTDDVIDGQPIPRASYQVFTATDARTLAREVGTAGSIFLSVSGPGMIALDSGTASRPARAALVAGTLGNGPARRPAVIESGRYFTEGEVDSSARVVVLSQELAAALADTGAAPGAMVGLVVRLQGATWQVVGVLAKSTDARGPARPALAAYVPLSVADAAMIPAPRPRAPSFLIKASRVEDLPTVQQRTESWLGNKFTAAWKNQASVSSYAAENEQARDAFVLFKLLMGSITGVSLVVGGVGIMNVLLASVVERTREIGVRKATGARNRDVLAQFLAESVAIAGAGSVLGTALGVIVAAGVAALMRARTMAEVQAGFSMSTLVVSVGAPIVIGLAFGTYPALRASRLSPIDAIRHE